MQELEKLYTVEEIAKITSLTTRTIRNYLRTGILKGRKIGGQWRFTNEDFMSFLNADGVDREMQNAIRQDVVDFLDGVNTNVDGKIQICTIVDLYLPKQDVAQRSERICELHCVESDKYLSFRYDYYESEGKGRFVLFSTPELLGKIMEILK